MRGPVTRFRLVSAAALLLLFPGAARSQAPLPPVDQEETEEEKKDPVKFKARLGYDESGMRAWAGRWCPLFLDLRNRGEHPFDGVVEISKSRDDDTLPSTFFADRVAMAPGTRKCLSTLVFIERGDRQLDVRLQAGRYGTRRAFLAVMPYFSEESCVLVCADAAAGTARALARPEEDAAGDGARLQRYCNVIPVDRLPTDRAGYGEVQAVVFETGAVGEIDEARLAALRAYVHAGGTLVVSAGRHAAAVQKSPLAALLPVTIAGSYVADGLDLRMAPSAPHGGAPPPDGRVFPGRHTLARTEPVAGPVAAGTAEAPLLVESRSGLGRVVFLAFSLSELARGYRTGGDRLLAGWILRREQGVFDVPEGGAAVARRLAPLPPWQVATSSYDPEAGLPPIDRAGLRAGVDKRMREGLVVRFPPVGSVAFLLGVYFLFLVPLNWLLWSWTRRKELAWATAAVLSVGFGIGYYQWGAYWGGSVLSGENVTVVGARPGSPVGRYWSFHSLYSPGHARGDLRVAGAEGFARQAPILSRLRVAYAERGIRALDYSIRWDPACLLSAFEIYPRAVRTFETEGTCGLGGGLEVRHDPDVRDVLHVTNRTPWVLRRLGVVQGGQADVLDAVVRPGQTLAVGPGRTVPEALDRARVPDAILRWEELPLGLLGPLARPLVVAWSDADVLHPVYEGYDVGQRHAVMLVVPVEPDIP